MNRFPKIDSPCPLDPAAQASIDGHCARCDKAVHCLDDMSEAQRRVFMQKASQPVCVSYRIPAAAAAAAAAALALTMAGPMQARNPNAAPAIEPAAGQEIASPQPDIPAQADDAEMEHTELDRIVMVGGISKPGEAEWIDGDDSLPELPIVRDSR